MLVLDIIQIFFLAVTITIWWLVSYKKRNLLLALSALFILCIGIWGIKYEYRWQFFVSVLSSITFLILILISAFRKQNAQSKTPWVTGICVSVLATFSAAIIYLFPLKNLPTPSGKYLVGSQVFEVIDKNRIGILGANSSDVRRLLVRVWYPAENTEGLDNRPYISEAESKAFAKAIDSGGYFFQHLKHVKTNTFENAPIVKLEQNSLFPVVVYSHGYMSFAGQNTALMEELASNGYIVYSIQHTYEALPTVFPNGDVIMPSINNSTQGGAGVELSAEAKKSYIGKTLEERFEGRIRKREEAIAKGSQIETISAQVWLEDREHVLNELDKGNVPNHVAPIVNASDFKRTAHLGMSFGGSAASAFCMTDSRCSVAINLDGEDYHLNARLNNLPVPLLMLYSDFDNQTLIFGGDEQSLRRGWNDFSYEKPEAAGLRSDIHRIQIKHLNHLGFSDFSLFVREPLRTLMFGSEEIIKIQNDLVLSFLDEYFTTKGKKFSQLDLKQYSMLIKRNDISDIRTWWLSKYPEHHIERVLIQTVQGDVELALYTKNAPSSVHRFLEAVDADELSKSSFLIDAEGNISLAFEGQPVVNISIDMQSNNFVIQGSSDIDSLNEKAHGFVLRGIVHLRPLVNQGVSEKRLNRDVKSALKIIKTQRITN